MSVDDRNSVSHTLVIGGGVIGVCCAWYLSKRGARVTLLERNRIGAGASFGNAGIIAPGHGAINKPGRAGLALKSLFDPLSPLYVAPRLDPELVRWLWAFLRTCTEEHAAYAMAVLGRLGRATSYLFDELVSSEKLDCCYHHEGYHEVYRTGRGLESAKREAEFTRRYGFHPETLSGGALREREPAINCGILGGIFFPEAARINPYRFVCEMAECARRQGAALRTGVDVADILIAGGKVRGVRTRDGETIDTDAVVLAAGAYSVPLARKLGLKLPLQAAKGYHRDHQLGPGAPELRRACMLGENLVFCTPMDGFLRLAGTLEFSGVNHEIRRPRLEQITNAAKRYFNGLESDDSWSEWCGLRPCIADGLPAVGPVGRYKGLFIATGHAMAGLTLGPITGKLIAESILDGRPGMDIAALSPDRF